MHAYKELPPLEPIVLPSGDPRKMTFGSLERSQWFEEARTFLPSFNPSEANPHELEVGSVAWHLWCEWDREEEALENVYGQHAQDGIADQACQGGDEPYSEPALQIVPDEPMRTRRKARKRTPGEDAALAWIPQMG